jgi:hypothetical protein
MQNYRRGERAFLFDDNDVIVGYIDKNGKERELNRNSLVLSALGFSKNAGPAANSRALQLAMKLGGDIEIGEAGDYPLQETLLIGNETSLKIGQGVRLYHAGAGGHNVIRNGNAGWSGLDQHQIFCVTIICASAGQEGIGTVQYNYIANNRITSASIYGGSTQFSNVSATLSYKSPNDTAFGTPVACPAFPGDKMRLVSANGNDTLWVAFGNGGLAGNEANLGNTFLPTSARTERVNIIDGPLHNPKTVTWTYTTIAGVPVIQVSEPNHGRQPGDMLEFLKGSGLEGLFEVYRLGNTVGYGSVGVPSTDITSAWKDFNGTVPNFYTIVPNTAINPTYWAGLASSGTARVHGHHLIKLYGGGEVDYGKWTGGGRPPDNSGDGIFLNGVSRYRYEDIAVTNSLQHGLFHSNVSKGICSPRHNFAPYGAFNLRAPAHTIDLYNAGGQSDDNNADAGSSDYAHLIVNFPHENCSFPRTSSATDYRDVRYRNSDNNQAYEVHRFFTSKGSEGVGLYAEFAAGMVEEQASVCMQLLTDEALLPNVKPGATTGLGGSGGWFNNVVVKNLRIKESRFAKEGTLSFGQRINVGTCTLDNVDLALTDAATSPGSIAIGGTGCYIRHLIVRNPKHSESERAAEGRGAFVGYVGMVYSGGTVDKLTIIDPDLIVGQGVGVAECGVWLVNPGGTVNEVELIGGAIQDGNFEVNDGTTISSGGSGYLGGGSGTVAVTIPNAGIGTGAAAFNLTITSGVATAVSITGRGSYYNTSRPGTLQANGNTLTTVSGGTPTVNAVLNVPWLLGSKKSYGIVNKGTIGVVRVTGTRMTKCDSPVFNNTATPPSAVYVRDATLNSCAYVFGNGNAVAPPLVVMSGVAGSVVRAFSSAHASGTMNLHATAMNGLVASSQAYTQTGTGLTAIFGDASLPIDINRPGFTKTVARQCVQPQLLAGTIAAGRIAVCDGTKFVDITDTTKIF